MAVQEEIQEKVLAEATGATPNYDIDYNDTRFGKVESDKGQALTELEQTYGGMINDSDRFFDEQIQASKDWADKQAQIQQEKTDFAIEQIEQQKEQANKDYIKEQSGAYVDWQKQSNRYGTQAEKIASAGLTNSGYSESSQVSMYNTYQNRIAAARESYNRAVLNYNNSIKDAQLQNNAALAEIAYQSLQKQLELSLQGFQYKNSLILEQANKKTELDNIYYNRYQDVLQQINTENALAEEIRQYNETQKWETEQKQLDREHDSKEAQLDRMHDAEQKGLDREHDSKEAQLDRAHQLKLDELQREFDAKQAEIDRQHDFALIEANTKAEKEKADHDYELAMKKLEQEHKYSIALLEIELENEKALESYKDSLETHSVEITRDSGEDEGNTSASGNPGIRFRTTVPQGTISTPYYQGPKNPDADKYGTFSNGYQPKGISGHGKLTKTGETVTFDTQTLAGQKQTVTQNVWKAEDGTLWYWDGRQNKYIQTERR